jgi:hypothetical protein
MAKRSDRDATEVGGDVPTNGALDTIKNEMPYRIELTIKGDADILFHKWNCEEVDAKSKASKGSKSKKVDNLENYVYRLEDGTLAIPGEYLRQAIVHAAKFRSDPRSSRKSAMDLFKAGVISLTPLASMGKKDWDYEDRRRAVIQRSGINRTRPACKSGWEATFVFLINTPDYIKENDFTNVAMDAGRLVGIGDFRPTYGRFHVTSSKVLNEE